MLPRVLADLVVVVHLAFILFVVLGGFLALRWCRVPWVHLPAVVWGVLLELGGWTCPLTPLEDWLRQLAGGPGYAGGFVDHYLAPVVYPGALTREGQKVLGVLVGVVNVPVYLLVWQRRRVTTPPR
jgi:hypothetical protein